MTVGARLHARWRVCVALAAAAVLGVASGGCERLRPGACSTGLIEQATTTLSAAEPSR